MTTRCLISFSGGETSGYMTKWLLEQNSYDEYLVVFANTGQENDATLEFVHQCDEHFFKPLEHPVVWIEAVQHPGARISPTHKVVTFETANRDDGRVFEEAIQKYGIPNSKFKDCTRNLKRNPIESYARSVGWANGEYDTAIGIRNDEIDRQSGEAAKRHLVYPLIDQHPMTKPKINAWWDKQPFRLPLKGYQGNCKWCWKKSMRKHLTLLDENPEVYDFPERMEKLYGLTGPEFRKTAAERSSPIPEDYRRKFFRGNKTVQDLKDELERRKNDGTFVKADDDAQVFDETLDVGAGCEESCEVWSEEDEAGSIEDLM